MLNWIGSNWTEMLTASLMVLGGLQAAAWAIAPLTETKLDDKVAGWLSKMYNALAFFSPKK